MSDVVKFPTLADIEDEAAAWIWRLDAETVIEADRLAFEVWLRRDVRHRRAFDELERLWRALDDLSEAKRPEKIATFRALPASAAFGKRWSWAASLAAL